MNDNDEYKIFLGTDEKRENGGVWWFLLFIIAGAVGIAALIYFK